ncbi:hypothetical protein LEMLEM_LOCUS20354 [Lemmus lemmus]
MSAAWRTLHKPVKLGTRSPSWCPQATHHPEPHLRSHSEAL